MITDHFKFEVSEIATVIFRICIQCINELIHFNLIICFLGFHQDLRQQKFPIYLFKPPLSCFPGSYYSHHILISDLWWQRFTTTSALHKGTFPQYANDNMRLIHIREAQDSIHHLAPYPTINSVRFFNRSCSVKDFIEQPQLMHQNLLT